MGSSQTTKTDKRSKGKRETGEARSERKGVACKLVKGKGLVEKLHKPSRSLQGSGGESGSKEAKRGALREGGGGKKETFIILLKEILGSC